MKALGAWLLGLAVLCGIAVICGPSTRRFPREPSIDDRVRLEVAKQKESAEALQRGDRGPAIALLERDLKNTQMGQLTLGATKEARSAAKAEAEELEDRLNRMKGLPVTTRPPSGATPDVVVHGNLDGDRPRASLYGRAARPGSGKENRPATGTVSGKVIDGAGKPYTDGRIVIHPAKGVALAAEILPDGTFRRQHVPAGRYDISISGTAAPQKYADPKTSGLQLVVTGGLTETTFELRE